MSVRADLAAARREYWNSPLCGILSLKPARFSVLQVRIGMGQGTIYEITMNHPLTIFISEIFVMVDKCIYIYINMNIHMYMYIYIYSGGPALRFFLP